MKCRISTIFLLLLLSMQACLFPKKVLYVENMIPDSLYFSDLVPPLTVHVHDRLSIHVSSKNPELVLPFNQSGVPFLTTTDERITPATGNGNQGAAQSGYLVAPDGTIDFPILGSLTVEGITLDSLRHFIAGELRKHQLVSDPVVKVELLNLRITMIGAVASVGVLEVPDTRVTLLEALAKAGGLSTNGQPDKVTVIREEEGGRRMYVNDIQNVKLFNSPTFYLQQNDIVYVEPKGGEMTPRETLTVTYIGIITGIAGMAVFLINVL
jgi:polysaccharide biosynthesis/export protein